MTTKNINVKKYNLFVKIKQPIYKLGFLMSCTGYDRRHIFLQIAGRRNSITNFRVGNN